MYYLKLYFLVILLNFDLSKIFIYAVLYLKTAENFVTFYLAYFIANSITFLISSNEGSFTLICLFRSYIYLFLLCSGVSTFDLPSNTLNILKSIKICLQVAYYETTNNGSNGALIVFNFFNETHFFFGYKKL